MVVSCVQPNVFPSNAVESHLCSRSLCCSLTEAPWFPLESRVHPTTGSCCQKGGEAWGSSSREQRWKAVPPLCRGADGGHFPKADQVAVIKEGKRRLVPGQQMSFKTLLFIWNLSPKYNWIKQTPGRGPGLLGDRRVVSCSMSLYQGGHSRVAQNLPLQFTAWRFIISSFTQKDRKERRKRERTR